MELRTSNSLHKIKGGNNKEIVNKENPLDNHFQNLKEKEKKTELLFYLVLNTDYGEKVTETKD